jgi:hypothetical protein
MLSFHSAASWEWAKITIRCPGQASSTTSILAVTVSASRKISSRAPPSTTEAPNWIGQTVIEIKPSTIIIVRRCGTLEVIRRARRLSSSLLFMNSARRRCGLLQDNRSADATQRTKPSRSIRLRNRRSGPHRRHLTSTKRVAIRVLRKMGKAQSRQKDPLNELDQTCDGGRGPSWPPELSSDCSAL